MTIIFNDDKTVQLRSGKVVVDTGKVQIGLVHQRRLRPDDAEPFCLAKEPWYRKPDAIVEAFCAVGIIGIITAIYWGWM